ncbi:hypothetical protein ACFE04_025535 [Oxalis oulophora]
MASVRLSCPSSFTLSLNNNNQLKHKNKNNIFSLVQQHSHFSHSSLSTTTTKQKTNIINQKFVLRFSTTTQQQQQQQQQQDPVVIDSTEEVELEQKQEIEKEDEEEFSTTRLIAQNVPWNSTAEDVRSLFQNHGTVLDVELSMYSKTMNRGLAFVEMASPEEALKALNNLQAYEYEGRTLRINYAKPKKQKTYPVRPTKPGPKFNLFVANLSFKVRSSDLKEFFNSAGTEVVSAEVIFHENPRRSTGYGFVSFRTKKQADEALVAFDGKDLMGRPLRVARSRQFVKERTEEDLQSSNSTSTELNASSDESDTSTELNASSDQSDTADVGATVLKKLGQESSSPYYTICGRSKLVAHSCF